MSKYAHLHHPETRKGPGDARPTGLQILEDENLIGKLTDKVFLVTGVSSGIGLETMRALYATGGHVFGTVRNMEKGQRAVEDVKARTKGGKITLLYMDHEDLGTVRGAAEKFKRESEGLNILINSAGVIGIPQSRTKDGFETQFQTNHLAHFLLFQLLKPVLLRSSTPTFPSRVVCVTSTGHRASGICFSDINFEKGPYDPWKAYGQSKTANIYLANEIERRYGSKGLHATSLHPGAVFTGMAVNVTPEEAERWKDPKLLSYVKDCEQGVATTVYAALSEEWKNKGGRYLADCVEQGEDQHSDDPLFVGDDGFAAWAYDEESAKRCWEVSMEMVGMVDGE